MLAAITSDVANLLKDFGQTVTLNGVSVQAIFDNAHELGSVGPIGMAGTQPMLTLPTASVPASPVGKACVVGATTYAVAAHEPDGTGVSVLMLEKST